MSFGVKPSAIPSEEDKKISEKESLMSLVSY
jgi:hypothetical protein